MAIQWEEKYSVGVKEIDDQHKQFIEIMNNFYVSFYANKSNDKLEEIFTKIINYGEKHFATEEKYFNLYNYEKSDEHKADHQKLKEKVLSLYDEFKAEKANIAVDLMDFLENWLVDHLINQDQKYIQCFKQNGLS